MGYTEKIHSLTRDAMGKFLVDEIALYEKRSRRRAIIFTVIPVLVAICFISVTAYRVNDAQQKLAKINQKLTEANDKSKKLQEEAILYQTLRDSFRLQYLEAKGFNFTSKKDLLDEAINANTLLAQLLKERPVDSTLKIKYFKKTFDEQKVWLALKETGYKNIEEQASTNRVLINAETNTVAYGKSIPPFDVKVIALTLIRAGFNIQHIYPVTSKSDIVQIIRTAPADGTPDKAKPFTAQDIVSMEIKYVDPDNTERNPQVAKGSVKPN